MTRTTMSQRSTLSFVAVLIVTWMTTLAAPARQGRGPPAHSSFATPQPSPPLSRRHPSAVATSSAVATAFEYSGHCRGRGGHRYDQRHAPVVHDHLRVPRSVSPLSADDAGGRHPRGTSKLGRPGRRASPPFVPNPVQLVLRLGETEFRLAGPPWSPVIGRLRVSLARGTCWRSV